LSPAEFASAHRGQFLTAWVWPQWWTLSTRGNAHPFVHPFVHPQAEWQDEFVKKLSKI
jgi:hypothetical protein